MNIPTLADVRAAQARLRGQVRTTPIIEWRGMVLKLEQLQIGGSFKVRGALNRILAAEPSELRAGVVTASGGNHGLGVAHAALTRSLPVTVFLPERAPRSTERRLEKMGAACVRGGRDWDDAWHVATARAAETGALALHPFEDPLVVAGQGTVALELLEQMDQMDQTGAPDVIVVAIGGGGLVGGVALTAKALSANRTRVVGVEPTGAPSMQRALAAGKVVELEEVKTIAGTLAPRAVGPLTLELARRHVDEIVLVDDDEMRATMRLLWDELRLLVEPAGAAALAAVLAGRVSAATSQKVAIVLCGANLDPDLAAATLTGETV